MVRLRRDGVWDPGWLVIWASTTRLHEDHLPDYRNDAKRHKRATGDVSC